MNINDISPDEIQNITPPKPININDINENEIEAVSLPMPEPQPQAEPTGMTNEIRQALAPEVEPDLSLFQRFAGGPVGDALAGIGNIARQSQTVSPEALAVAQQQTVIPSKEEVVATLINNAQQGAQAIRNVLTAVGGLAAMMPSFATDIARGGTDILASGAEMLGADQLGRRIKEEGKLAADTVKQLAAESTANLRQFYEGKPTDVEGEMLAEELQPSKKQGALAKAMTTKFLWDAENMPPDAFKAKYPEALPIDTFNAKFEEVLRGQSLPQTVKSFFFDMPLESVKTIYGAIAGDPEVRQRFIERPAETIVETGIGLGIGIKGTELLKATGDITRKATVFEKPQTIDEAAVAKMQSNREMTDFLRKNTEQRDAMREQSEAMTGAPNRGMSAEELASTMREPPPQNMEATTEFLTRKPAVTFGEAERLQGEAIPEGEGMTVQPTAPTNKLDQLFKREPSKPWFIGGKSTQKGAFNPSSIIDAISSVIGGKKKERPFEVTIGDPILAKEFEKTFKATQAAETAKKQTSKAREQSTMSAYKQGLVDLFSPIIDVVPKGPEREKVMSIVHDIFYLGSPAEAFMRKTKDIVLDKVKHEDYAAYMAAKAITTFREHIEKPDRIKLAEDFLKSIDPKIVKDYEKITNEWHEKAWKPILEELKASGLDDPLIINNIMGNENYAPFFPAKQLGLPHGIGENAPGAGIYKLKGGMGDYMDVLAAKMKKGIAMLAAAKINQGKLIGIDSMLKYDKANIKEAMPEYKGFYKERDPLTGKILEIPIVEFPEPQSGSGLALLEARRDGKKVGYYVPKSVKRAFDMAMGEGDTLGATMRGFQKMTQGFRNVWIEYNPIWQVAVNAPRDIIAATIEMPKIGNKFKFMGNLAKVAPAAVGDYVPILGKVVQAFTGYDRKAFEKDVTKGLEQSKLMSTRDPQYLGETDLTVGESLKRAYGLTEKHTGILKALDTIQEFGKDIERMTKVAAELTLKGDKRFSDHEVKNIVRQIGSPAFGVRGGGDLFKTIKTATMFYNATKQSWVAAKYFLEKDPVGAITFASIPMALYAFTIMAENGTFGDDYKKAYTLMKSYDKANKLNFPIGYKDNGEVEYISLPLPQFLKPVMRIMRTAAKENPKFLDSIIKGFSEELPMLNPVVGLINRVTSYGDEKPPAAELTGQEIMTQDQWDAGGAIKGEAFLKAFWNDYLLGSQIRLKVKPNERNETWEDKAIRFVFGKVYKTNFNEDLDTSATKQKQAIQRLKTREAASAETPQQQQKIIQDMVKEGYIPQKGVFKSTKQKQFIDNLRKTDAAAARQMEIYTSAKSKEEKVKAFQKLNDLLKKKKK